MSETALPARYTLTAALPYANGPVHIGHLAGVYIPADTYARYLRMRGREVAFICGSDEHGVAITIKAKKEGLSYQQAVDKYHALIEKSFADLGISFDIYSRTSRPIHHETSQAIFRKMAEDGQFVEQTSQQYFDPAAQQFLADRYIMGTCPRCGHDAAYGDQCENCGSTLSPQELINPRSTLSGETPILKETKHWYLPLDRWEPWLKEWILEGKKDIWKSNVYGQCKSWLDGGLQARAVTRDLDWGVPVPLPGAEGKVLYVWFDAPIGYISATKEWALQQGKDWSPWWQAEDTKLVHFIGKDNIVFHSIIFPVILKAHGGFIVPDQVPANEFLNLEGNKISTSRNWAVWLHEYLEDFPGKQDVLRYVLTATAPETKDNDFTWKDFQARNNNELVAILGNFVNRTLVLVHKNFEGKVPAAGPLTDPAAQAVKEALDKAQEAIAHSLENYRFREALAHYMDLARAGNKYLTETEPWKLIKQDVGQTGQVLNLCLQITANLALLAEPFLPIAGAQIRSWLGMPAQAAWEQVGQLDLIPEGRELAIPTLLFEKIEDAAIQAQIDKLEARKQENLLAGKAPEPAKEVVSYEDFTRMDLRVATITAAEAVPKTKKLLKLTLDTGLDIRTVVSGIAEHFEPGAIVGQQVVLLANLAPRDIKGITSQGMILMAEDKDGRLQFVQPGASVWNGAVVK